MFLRKVFRPVKYVVRKIVNSILFSLFRINFLIYKRLYGFAFASNIISKLPSSDDFNVKLMRLEKAMIGTNCCIETPIHFYNCDDLSNFSVGDNCYIGKDCYFDLKDKINVCNNVTIAMKVTFITHMDAANSNISNIYKKHSAAIHMGDNTYIGAGSIILMGTVIEGSVIGAGSIVPRDFISKNEVVAGNPAKIMKSLAGRII